MDIMNTFNYKLFNESRGIGKSKFLCRLMMYHVVEQWKNVVMIFKDHRNIKHFLDTHLRLALYNEKYIKHKIFNDKSIKISRLHEITDIIRVDDIEINLMVFDNIYTRDIELYKNNGHIILKHDSVNIDLEMIEELKILNKSDSELLLHVGHEWKWELLHRDYLERLKSFAASV